MLSINDRCRDCPLEDNDVPGNCEIHEQWTLLITNYKEGLISPGEYVEKSLAILEENKNRLRIKLKGSA